MPPLSAADSLDHPVRDARCNVRVGIDKVDVYFYCVECGSVLDDGCWYGMLGDGRVFVGR